MKSLVIVSKEYPSPGNPVYPFVDALACALADLGVAVTVVAPQDRVKARLGRVRETPPDARRDTPGGTSVRVLRPRYVSMGNKPVLAGFTYRHFRNAARRAIAGLPEMPDALYGHFIWTAGLTVCDLSKAFGLPAFMAYGESSPKLYAHLPLAALRKKLRALRGVIAVSSENRDQLLADGLYPDPARVRVFPNAVDASAFHPMDRAAARAALGFPADAFIVGYCGYFSERKGALRLSRALDAVGGVSSVFIGRGEQPPTCAGVLFKGSLPHADVPQFLAACDVFALPTMAEGCCNAIVEAMACGLPVISSNGAFNDDLLDETNAIRIDPTDERALADAIRALRDDPKRRALLAEGALQKAASLTLPARAAAIRDFMEDMI